MSLPIPAAAMASHIAVLGKNGSGKSYAIRGVVESLLDDESRVCVIDPTGVWYGLRTMADGKRAGYKVAIFGGPHADFPLQQHHGEELAEIIGTSNTPAILDVSLLRTGERTRLFTDFAEGLMRKNRGPLHLVIDEAHLFAPQGRVNDPQSGAMLHAANNLVSLGRSRGLRVVLISQRPAKVHKDSLTQVETLIAMRLIAPQDRKAVEEWIKDNTDAGQAKDFLSSLATMKTGTGWVWAPEMGILEQVKFPKIRTLDTGRTPDGSEAAGKVLATIDRDAITARLKVVAQEAEANDPKKLKAKIAELERAAKAKPPAAPAVDTAEIERHGYARGYGAALKDAERSIIDALRSQGNAIVQGALALLAGKEPPPARPMAAPAMVRAATVRQQPAAVPRSNGAAQDLPRGEAATLAALIQYPAGLLRTQLTVLTGYKRSSRDAYIQRLRERGFVDTNGERVTATEDGIAAMPNAEPLPTGDALQQFWKDRLPEGERKTLEVLLHHFPDAVDKEAIDEATGYKRSSRDAYLQRLSAKELVTTDRGMARAAETLFA